MRSMRERLAACDPAERRRILSRYSAAQLQTLRSSWRFNARPDQLIPGSPGAAIQRDDWRYWLCLAGRGWGKTRVGAETVKQWAEDPAERILLVGPTWTDDVEATMLAGPSGLMACYAGGGDKPTYNSSDHEIRFPSGAVGITRSGSEPERLRGPQFRKFWIDELCAMQCAQAVWDQVMFGFRIPGSDLRGVITTTPKPLAVLTKLVANSRTIVTRGSSDDNRANLDAGYISDVIDPYRGTRIGRQEINAEILSDVPGALWTRSMIEAARIRPDEIRWDKVARIVVGVDPAVTSKADSDETGIVVCAMTYSRHVLVLADRSLRASTDAWARAAIAAYRYFRADRIIGEVNQGGDLIEAALRNIDPLVAYRGVRATRGKLIRAEPVAALYEQGRIHHAGPGLDALEDQMCTWSPQAGMASPDRMDALVWAIHELLVDNTPASMMVQFAEPHMIA